MKWLKRRLRGAAGARDAAPWLDDYPRYGPFPAPITFDFEATIVGQYLNTTSPLFPVAASSAIDQQVVMAVRGDHEAYWLERQRLGLPPLREGPES
jgi:hypothetical protein